MNITYRFEIYPNQFNTGQLTYDGKKQIGWFEKYCNIKIQTLIKVNYFLVDVSGPEIKTFTDIAETILTDSVTEVLYSAKSEKLNLNAYLKDLGFQYPVLCDVSFKPGVTDNSAQAVQEAFKLHPELKNCEINVASGQCYFFEFKDQLMTSQITDLCYQKFANTLLQNITVINSNEIFKNNRFTTAQIKTVKSYPQKVNTVNLNVDSEKLVKLNLDNCWALSLDELYFVKDYFKTLDRNPTDVEIEIIAQSWSEHCKHKIFASHIDYTEGVLPKGYKSIGNIKVKSLFKTFIKGATEKIQQDRGLDWLVSLFHDNAGIVRFDPHLDICIKVETHNSPSALDPYGGALTGILGVNRDILGCGIGAKPIANTNVFCLAEDVFFKKNNIEIPEGLKNPDRIAEGVHLGVQDGGNKSGIPTVNGAFVYDHDFVGKPLVFCGTIGVLPHTENQKKTSDKRAKPGDYIVMSGGKIGKDGIHGATFSSLELNDQIPASVVQIGDPITQKRLTDFLLEARRLDLFSSVTDNGAGGLSSSIGEMAQATNGAIVELEKAPTKYPGLSPFEIMVSESQERMTFAVSPNKIETFLNLSKKRNVLSTVVGEFTDQGRLQVKYFGETVADLNLHFLHNALKPMELIAHIDETLILEAKNKHWLNQYSLQPENKTTDLKTQLLSLLSSPDIRSHENLIRRYDHEVKAATVVKPFTGHKEIGYHAPTDAAVVWLAPHGGAEDNAISISCGIAPQILDSYQMAVCAVDEAVRNAVCVGADPDKMVLVDNFCWPDPVFDSELPDKNPGGQLKLAHLVRCAKAIYDISTVFGMPFVSGKDSMKNDFTFINKQINKHKVKEKISVKPTLLITALAQVHSLNHVTTSEVKNADDLIYLLGPDQLTDFAKQIQFYRQVYESIKLKYIQSAHDVSGGGVLVCLAEKIMATPYGLKISTNLSQEQLTNENPGRLIVSIKPEFKNGFEKLFESTDYIKFLGETDATAHLKINSTLNVANTDCLDAYRINV